MKRTSVARRLLLAAVALALAAPPLAAFAADAPARPKADRGTRASALASAATAGVAPLAADDEFDTAPAAPIPPGPFNGTVTNGWDIRKVVLIAGQKITFEIDTVAGDVYLGLHGPGQDYDYRTGADAGSGPTLDDYPFAGAYTVPLGEGGVYYLVVYGEGDYSCDFDVNPAAADDYIPGALLGVSPVADALDAGVDPHDVYSVALAQGGRVTLGLTGPAGTDFDIAVFGPSANDVAMDEPLKWGAATDSTEDIVFTAPAAGTYYIDVFAWSGSGAYTVTYTLGMAPAKTYAEIEGSNRYATAVKASKTAFPAGSTSVVIATGTNWPDALGGAALAFLEDGPILLTDPDALTPSVATEIARLTPSEAIVLGSADAVSDDVFDAVEDIVGAGNVTRIGGSDRYATADKIARRVAGFYGGQLDSCFVATGMNFPDALGASPVSAACGIPILLVSPTRGLSAGTLDVMADLGMSEGILLGSDAAVPESVYDQVEDELGYADRLGGDNRYETAAIVSGFGADIYAMTYDKVAIATGENFPDALAAGVMQGLDDSLMLLTPKASFHSAPAAVLKANKWDIDTVRFLGSTDAVSDTARTGVKNALK